MKIRLFRAFVCMLLICCILINCAPFRAKATLVVTTTGYLITVNVTPVVAAIMAGLGVGAIATSTGAFDSLVDNCVLHLQEIGLCEEFSIDVFGYEVNGTSLFGLTPRIIEAIRSWLYDSGIVTETTTVNSTGFSGTQLTNTDFNSPYWSLRNLCNSYPNELKNLLFNLWTSNGVAVFDIQKAGYYLVGVYWGEDGRLMEGVFEIPSGATFDASLYGVYHINDLNLVSSKAMEFNGTMTGTSYTTNLFYDKIYAESTTDFSTSCYFAIDWSQKLRVYQDKFIVNAFCKKPDDITWRSDTTGVSKTKGSLVQSCYYIDPSDIIWDTSTSSTITVADGLNQGEIASQDESLEIGYPKWYTNSKVLTTTDNQEVQVYPFPYSNALSDYYTATQSGIWNGTLSNTDSGSDTDNNSGTNSGSWTPPADPGAFALDLTSFFPFCIPFDLYDFLTCLNAGPVAPVINWELVLPGFGTYTIVLDLSPFDSVAQLLRRLQLLLFIIGLAVKTRDLIKG